MTAGADVVLIVAVIAAIADWWAVARTNRRVEYIAKPATLAALVVMALLLHPAHHGERVFFVVALVLSLAGDVFLMLEADLFVAGLASFLLAHIAFVAGFLSVRSVPRYGPVVAIAVGLAVAPRILRSLRAGADRALTAPVVTYMFVISAMVAASFATRRPLAILAALTFYASDSLIAEQRFVQPRSWQPVAIMVTYHLAQIGFVLSLLR